MEVFKRKEKKYLLTEKQYKDFLLDIDKYIKKNEYFESDIWSIYYDTDSNELIRRSIEKPLYKEKLRIRSYDIPKENEKIFVELKKKYKGIVYKRRAKTDYLKALNSIGLIECDNKQIENEIKNFVEYYKGLHPSYCIGTKRYSYEAICNKNLRFTFDVKPVYRKERLFLGPSNEDKPITDKIILEIKANNSVPLWLSEALDKNKIYPTSFSKVGTAYLLDLRNKLENREVK